MSVPLTGRLAPRSMRDELSAMRADQIRSHAIIAQAINVQRLRDIAVTSRNPLDKRDWRMAEDVLRDMLESLMGDERYRVRPSLFASGWRGPEDDPYAPMMPDLMTQEGGEY